MFHCMLLTQKDIFGSCLLQRFVLHLYIAPYDTMITLQKRDTHLKTA